MQETTPRDFTILVHGVKRNKKGRLVRLIIKYLLEKNQVGEKYEEIRKRNITPPNITDIRRMRKNEYYRTMNYVNKTVNNNKELILPENYLSEDESDGNTEYFNLQIKLPNGRTQTLKVYENDDANKVIEEFCKIHSIDDNIKNKLVTNILNCQKQFLVKGNKMKIKMMIMRKKRRKKKIILLKKKIVRL